MTTPAASHIVKWDVQFTRPIVGGNIEHPVTGEIMPQSGTMRSGPPSVDFILHNIDVTYNELQTLRRPYHVSVDRVYVAVAKLVKDGILEVVSVNASAYAFVLVCIIKVPKEEYEKAQDRAEEEFLRNS